jgi:hypothetical protein
MSPEHLQVLEKSQIVRILALKLFPVHC